MSSTWGLKAASVGRVIAHVTPDVAAAAGSHTVRFGRCLWG